MIRKALEDGKTDGLSPLESLDLEKVGTFSDLLQAMGKTSFSGRKLSEAYKVLLDLTRDQECRLVLTISGAMTVAKQGTIICDMIDRGMVSAIVATGALIAHGLTESIGLTHYRMDPGHSAKQDSLTALRFFEKTCTHLHCHPAGHFAHRGQQRKASVIHLNGFIGNATDLVFNKSLGQRPFRSQMQVGEEQQVTSEVTEFI